jgi:hypothetical protein
VRLTNVRGSSRSVVVEDSGRGVRRVQVGESETNGRGTSAWSVNSESLPDY